MVKKKSGFLQMQALNCNASPQNCTFQKRSKSKLFIEDRRDFIRKNSEIHLNLTEVFKGHISLPFRLELSWRKSVYSSKPREGVNLDLFLDICELFWVCKQQQINYLSMCQFGKRGLSFPPSGPDQSSLDW